MTIYRRYMAAIIGGKASTVGVVDYGVWIAEGSFDCAYDAWVQIGGHRGVLKNDTLADCLLTFKLSFIPPQLDM